jgi:hypothetical protein
MSLCDKYIYNGIVFRYIITIFSFFILSFYYKNSRYLYLILLILLSLLDVSDNIFTYFYKIYGMMNGCTKKFYYQYLDKICDSVSYLLLFLFFKFDNLLLYFIFYRIIGLVLFYFTKNRKWLILFFDFAKEFLLYTFIFGKNYEYLPFFIFCKIGFEYYFHAGVDKSY